MFSNHHSPPYYILSPYHVPIIVPIILSTKSKITQKLLGQISIKVPKNQSLNNNFNNNSFINSNLILQHW